MIDDVKDLNLCMLATIAGIVMIIVGISMFALSYPELMFGLVILLVLIIGDVLWIRITITNNLGRAHLLGVILFVAGCFAIGLFHSSAVDFLIKSLIAVIILIGTIGAFIVLEEAN